MSAEHVLVGDIGGTNARLAIATISEREVTLDAIEVRGSKSFAGAAELIRDYGKARDLPRQACFAVAGPIRDNAGFVTNVGWSVDGGELQRAFGFSRVLFMNDFAALATAVPSLGPEEVVVVKPGMAKPGEPISVMGAGTGFGLCLLAPGAGRYGVVPTEGGHANFPPSDALEMRIWQRLYEKKNEHVSIERILSGAGLGRLYALLTEFEGKPRQRTPEEISRRAAEDENSASARALELFCNIFGSIAGNIVLTQGATGGVYLGGGVLMKNADALLKSRFAERFAAKDLMAEYLRGIPVYLIRAEYAALKGAGLWFGEKAGPTA